VRIIAGDYRGRRYKAIEDPLVRPISGRIKQSLFDIIAGLIPGCKLLDLFAGTGAVGFEALSRGAAQVVFVDHASKCIKAIEATGAKLGFSAKMRAQPGNVLQDLSWVPFRCGIDQFDLVFMGPPYKDAEKRPLAFTQPALAKLVEAKLYGPKAWIICQHHVKEEVEAPKGLKMVRREKYGDTYVSFFRPDGN
jgi:16S rRNA (guanine966-N2)-methyltransferase